MLEHGPLVATQELAKTYKEKSNSTSHRRIMSSELFQILAKHLNVMQFEINGQAFMSENTSCDFSSIISFKNAQKDNTQIFNKKVDEAIGDYFQDAVKYMDSKRDRDTAVALLEKITSVNFVSKSLYLVLETKQECKTVETISFRILTSLIISESFPVLCVNDRTYASKV